MRPFRIGITASPTSTSAEWRDKLRRFEGWGFDVVLVNDHLTGHRFAPLVALASAAEITERLRLSILVLSNDYRHPVMLAKEAATLDLLSDGRLEVGIGAGWMRADYEQSGLTYDTPKVRIARLREGLAILRGAWGDGPFSFEGRHYSVTDLELSPKPVQRPCPPILLGGGGPSMLRFAAQEGNIVNITNRTAADGRGVAPDDVGLAPLLKKLSIVKDAAAGREDQVEVSVTVRALAIDRQADDVYPALKGHIDVLRGTPSILEGSVDGVVEDLLRWNEECGISYFILGDDTNAATMARVVDRLRRHV